MKIHVFLNTVYCFTSFGYCAYLYHPDDAEAVSCKVDRFKLEHTKWNKSVPSKVYQESYCAVRCSSEGKRAALISFDIGFQSLDCLDCSCKRPECEHYGICCPGMDVEYVPLSEFKNEITYLDDFYGYRQRPSKERKKLNRISGSLPYNYNRDIVGFPKLGCNRIDMSKSFLFIRSCFKDFKGDGEIVRLCEQDVSNHEVTVDYFAWAVDTATHVVYRNMYCAVCNRAVKPKQLLVRTDCTNFMTIYQITDPDEMLRRTLNSSDGCCKVEEEFPDNTNVFSCNGQFFWNVPVSSCDDAPNEWHYDEDIARACKELNHTTYRMNTLDGRKTYKNIFCSICNMNVYPQYGPDQINCIANSFNKVYLPFSLLINFGKSSSVMSLKTIHKTVTSHANCSKKEWSSPDNRCVTLVCSPGKILINGSCSSAFPNIYGLHYSMNFWLIRKSSRRYLKSDSLNGLMVKIQQTLIEYSEAQSIKIGYIVDNSLQNESHNSSENLEHIIWVESNLKAFKDVSRDKFEKTLIGHFIDQDGICIFDDRCNLSFPMKFFWSKKIAKRASHSKTINYVSNNYKHGYCGINVIKPISVTNLLFCSYISFRPSHYDITVDYTTLPPKITVTVEMNVTQVNISTISELNMIEVDEDGNLNVCHEVLDTKLNEMEEAYRKSNFEYRLSDVNLAQYIVTMTSFGCSMICLILTLSAYLWFPILRNTAGQNHIFLCLSLLLAQTSLIITAHRPREDIICKLTGIMTHFLWLWMFSWTFICSFHMFTVFTSSTRSQPAIKGEELKKLLRRIICSLIGPKVIVVSVIVVSVIVSDGEHIGYSHVTCYLNSTLLVGISMVLPIALSLACTIVFFAKTVFSIHQMCRLRTSQPVRTDKQQVLFVYVKISSMTGIFWTLAIIAEAADLDALRIVSIIINGFQGVFIFLSYICNKRVLKMITMKTSQTETIGTTTATSGTELNIIDIEPSFTGP